MAFRQLPMTYSKDQVSWKSPNYLKNWNDGARTHTNNMVTFFLKKWKEAKNATAGVHLSRLVCCQFPCGIDRNEELLCVNGIMIHSPSPKTSFYTLEQRKDNSIACEWKGNIQTTHYNIITICSAIHQLHTNSQSYGENEKFWNIHPTTMHQTSLNV
jgi:hypothetical protein